MVPRDVVQQVPPEYRVLGEVREVLVAPLRWEPDGFGAIVLAAKDVDARFTDQGPLRLARGIADITSLALGNARRLSELERFHELVATWMRSTGRRTPPGSRPLFVHRGPRRTAPGRQPAGMDRRRAPMGRSRATRTREGAVTAARTAADAGQDQSLEYRVSAPDGRASIRDMVHVVRSAQGPRQLRGLMIDITERKRAEQALRRSERKYSEAFRREREAAQRLRALDEMKNASSRRITQPADASDLHPGLRAHPRTDRAQPAEGRRARPRGPHRGERPEARTTAVGSARPRSAPAGIVDQRRPTDLAELVHRSVEQDENTAGRDIQVEVESITVSVNAAKVERILENLLSNAIRHTPDGTRIWIPRFSGPGRRGDVDRRGQEGHGIPHELHEAVFKPFRQAPGSSSDTPQGVGVGLSLVRRFAELHGGRASLEDREGGGSSFHVFLPGG